jgi:antitoxin component YwqK of YwqJK toxin-antitoxin module
MKKTIRYFLFFLLLSASQSIFAQNNVFKSSGKRVNNKKEGKWTYKYPSGQIKLIAHYKQGIPKGKWTFFYKDGQIKATGIVDCKEWSKTKEFTVLHTNKYAYKTKGVWKEYYKTGKPKSYKIFENEGRMTNGTFFDEEGRLTQRLVAGKVTDYYKTGAVKEIIVAKKRQLFDENGKPIEKEKNRTFLDALHANAIVFYWLDEIEQKIINDIDILFKQYKIKNTDENITEFKEQVTKYTSRIAGDINKKMAERYEELPQKELDRYIAIALSDKSFNDKIIETRFIEFYKEFYPEVSRINSHILHRVIEKLQAKDQALKLRVIIDQDTLQNNNNKTVQLFLITKNKKYPKLNVLTNDSFKIQIPSDLKYEEISEVLVIYKGYKMKFFNREKILRPYKNLPKNIGEIFEPFKPEYFTQKTHWTLQIYTKPEQHKEAVEFYNESSDYKPGKKMPYRLFVRFTIENTEENPVK